MGMKEGMEIGVTSHIFVLITCVGERRVRDGGGTYGKCVGKRKFVGETQFSSGMCSLRALMPVSQVGSWDEARLVRAAGIHATVVNSSQGNSI